MKQDQLFVTGVERHFDETEIIVSKTDTKGRITYANDVFLRVAGYSEKQLLGQPHSIIRHPAVRFLVALANHRSRARDFCLCD